MLLSSYKGKVVVLAFLSTTCPHCQRFVPTLSSAEREFGPKGVQVLGAAFNEMANMYLPDFVKQYRPEFPFGWAMRDPVLEFLQHSAMFQLYVPIVVGIDRQGVIREQYTGDSAFFENEQGNLRAMIERLLNQSPSRATSGGRKKSSGKS